MIIVTTREQEDIFEIKPGAYGIHINLRAIFLRFRKKTLDPVLVVPNRILYLFEQHGVAISQIPRLIPEFSLSQLRSPDTLLTALTPEVVEKIADMFRVQRKWLEGATDVIYDGKYYCYKNPWKFFEEVQDFKIDSFAFPLIAFTSQTKFDCSNGKNQLVVLVQRERFTELDGKDVYRYKIVDGFLWGYFKSRIQLKAMMRIWWKKYKANVPTYYIEPKLLEQMEDGKLIPHKHLFGSKRLKHENLEDFALTPEESAVSQEQEDLPEVFEYIEMFKLNNMRGKNPAYSSEVLPYT